MSIIKQIEAHEKEVRLGLKPSNLQFCIFCNEPSRSLKRHEVRHRILYFIIKYYVYRKEVVLCRWKCIVCKKTFTYYPEYSLPYKRYIKSAIVWFSALYLNNAEISYMKAVKHSFNVIVHKDDEQTKQSEFNSTTVWRWQSFLSSLIKLEQKALQLIRESTSESTVFRESYSINRQKYRSQDRKAQLLKALKLLKVEETFRSIFRATIFPQFASRYV